MKTYCYVNYWSKEYCLTDREIVYLAQGWCLGDDPDHYRVNLHFKVVDVSKATVAVAIIAHPWIYINTAYYLYCVAPQEIIPKMGWMLIKQEELDEFRRQGYHFEEWQRVEDLDEEE